MRLCLKFVLPWLYINMPVHDYKEYLHKMYSFTSYQYVCSGVARVFKWGADIKKRAHAWCMNDMTCEGMHIVLSVLIHAYASV